MSDVETLQSMMVLSVNASKMTATLQLNKGKDEELADKLFSHKENVHQAITKLLAGKGIVFGIQHHNIRAAADNPIFFTDIVVAEGEVPKVGPDGEEKFNFRTSITTSFKEDGQGLVDYHELNLIENTEKGAVLYTWTDPQVGECGHDVYGKELPGILGQSIRKSSGLGTIMDEENHQIIADMDGQVLYKEGKIIVLNVYEVAGDVDLSVGNIYFKGTVHIRGDVREGFRIMAEGDVLVDGSVEGSQVNARGKIVIKNGINGMGKGLLKADGDIVCRYIENCAIESKASVTADVIINSKITCSGNLNLSGRRANFISGESMVGGLVTAHNLGTENRGDVVLNFAPRDGVDCTIEKSYRSAQREFEDVQRKVEFYVNMSKKMQLNDKHQAEFKRLVAEYKDLESDVKQLQEQVEKERKKLESAYRDLVSVIGTMYAGVKIVVGHIGYRAANDVVYSHFWLDRGEIHHDTGVI